MAEEEPTSTNGYWSDSDDGGDEQHERFLAAVAKLDKKKHVPPSARREPSLQVSEFHLSKESDDPKNEVKLWQLAKTVSQRPSHRDVARKLKSVQRKSLTLPKPLDKPEANRIQREVGYEDVKTQLDAWEPIVHNNRVADGLVFPLNSATQHSVVSHEDFVSDKQTATELEKQFKEILHKDDPPEMEKEEEFSLSLEEMVLRRKELARLRVRESYRHAKAHYQKKIKSKKYHRLARKERIRNELKEFESLQQKDPEAALKKLDELEKERALERASLRHRSTGKWAQNQAVRAKYDKESRQVLSEQLKLSKALTQKVQSDSDSSEEDAVQPEEPSDNPWVSNHAKTESEINDFLSGYRKFWDAKTSDGSPNEQDSSSDTADKVSNNATTEKISKGRDMDATQKAALSNAVVSYSETYPEDQDLCKAVKVSNKLPVASSFVVVEKAQVNNSPTSQNHCKPVKDIGISKIVNSPSGKWFVLCYEEPKKPNLSNLNEIFETLNEKISEKTKIKINKLKKDLEGDVSRQQLFPNKRKEKSDAGSISEELLKMKKQRLQIDLDEELLEEAGSNENKKIPAKKKNNEDMLPLVSRSSVQVKAKEKSTEKKASTCPPELDPNKFISSKPVKLHNLVPDEVSGGNEGLDDSEVDEEAEAKHLTISEAFADDDVVAEFSKEKDDVTKSSKQGDIDLSLPGWGEWGGHKVKPNMRKRKRFIVKVPVAPPRKDANKGNLIINENEDTAAREHQVSNLPYPFTRVRDFEASIRAPISSSFIPQSAHRKLIKPAVRTKSGTVIPPMDKSVLFKKSGREFEQAEHIKLDRNVKKKKGKRH